TIDSQDLLEYWSKAGLRIDEGISVLKQCGQPIAGTVNAVFLSGFLERELSDAAAEAPVAVKTAIIALHSCIDYLRCCVKENETQTEYLQKQLQLANQRRTMLIEELEQNQLSIEQAFESRLRETEERFKMKLGQVEEKSRQEKRDLQNDIDKLDDDLSRSKQSEASMRNKMTMLERQCGRLNEEAREFTETISQLEQLNRQLRTELSKAMQPRPQDDNANVLMWKQKTELLVAHNKRLREKVQELSLNQKKNKAVRDVNPLFTKWSSAFKSQVMMFRKRRVARGDTLSEMDSEPEAIFARVRRRRLRKRKERKQRHERLLARLSIQQDDASSSTSTEGKIPKSHSSSTVHKNSIKQLEDRVGKLQDDHRRELAQMKLTASKTLAEALNDQEKQLNSQYERQLELRISGERSQLEQSFANEKMKLMTRLQEDFESELQRISASTQSEGPAAIEQYKRQIKMLESSLEGQRNGYEKRLAEMRDKYRNQVRAHTSSVLIDKNTNNFLALIEKYKNLDPSTSIFEQISPRLGVEKRHHHMPFQRSMSSMSSRCERCELVDARLRELYHTCTGDTTTAESGIEDIGSSAGSLSDDKIVLKREIRKLKGRLEAAKEKVAELRVLFSMQNGSSSARYKCSMGGSQDSQQTAEWRRTPITKWSDVNPTIERLESEKLILESRLSEAQLLIKNLVEQYRKQLDETARLGGILQDMYAQQSPNENGSIAKSAPPTSRPSS
ncbi:unnamed protein product, partial [Mesorhabditis belari]